MRVLQTINRVALLLATILAVGLGALALYLISLGRANAHIQYFAERLAEVIEQDGINPAELSVIVEHPVVRVCFDSGIGFGEAGKPLHRAPERWDFTVDAPEDATLPEHGYGIYVVGPDNRATYGELTRFVFRMPSDQPRCWTGERLALRFESVDPLAGGRLVDLDAPDFKPQRLD